MRKRDARSVRALVAAAVAANVAGLTGCSDSSGSRLHLPTEPRYSYEEIEWFDVDGSMNIAEVEEGTFGSYPQWNGEDPAISTSIGQQYICPEISASVMLLASNQGTFVIAGVFEKVAGLPMRNGYPAARYAVPNTMHYNTDLTYWIQGGVVEVTCRGRYFNTGRGRVWVGDLHPYAYFGAGGPASVTRTGGGSLESDQGWAFKNAANYRNGSAGSGNWAEVLDRYLEEGVCTSGWSIIIDGVKVCDG